MALLFERFISRERNEPPDMDIDFEHERRKVVLKYRKPLFSVILGLSGQ
jgi:DNA polymerase III alpha subunit